MTVTFCGHAQFHATGEQEARILTFLEETIKDQPACMYLGQHGDFDRFAYHCCKKYKKSHPAVSLVFVTPYLPKATIPFKFSLPPCFFLRFMLYCIQH